MRWSTCAAISLLFCASSLRVNAGSSSQENQSQAIFRSSTAAVAVDIVVRGKGGVPITDLSRDDFEVYEDGVLQRITSFDVVDTRSATNAPEAAARRPQREPSAANTAPAVIALAFEELGPSGRQIAAAAAEKLLQSASGPATFVGVFAIDRALHVLVPYTNDLAALRRGIRQAATRAGYPLEHAPYVPGAEYSSAEGGQPSQSTKDDEPFARGHAALLALGRLVDSLKVLPGRKSVLLFSQGLALGASEDQPLHGTRSPHFEDHWLTDNRHKHFLRIVERANDAQVSFYTFDAAGLRTDSAVRGFGRAPYVGLRFIAEETGGAFVENTNDLTKGVQRAVSDLQQHYVVGYTSTKPAVDGRYRSIKVKVKRTGVTVLARRGYRAVSTDDYLPIRARDVIPLLLLEQPTVPNMFSMRVEGLVLPEPKLSGRIAILAHIPSNAATFVPGDMTEERGRVTVLARVKDVSDRVISMTSEEFTLARAKGALEPAGADGILFHRLTDLPEGVHTLEVLAYDVYGARASVRISTLEIRKRDHRPLHLSSVVLARRAFDSLAQAASRGERNVLRFARWVLVPHLDRTLPPDREITFAFAAYRDRGNSSPLVATLRLTSRGYVLSEAPLTLEPPDESGRVAYLGRLSVGAVPAGTYEITVTVSQGTQAEARSLTLTVQ